MVRVFTDIEQEIGALGRSDQVRLLRALLEELEALPDAMSPRVLRAEIESTWRRQMTTSHGTGLSQNLRASTTRQQTMTQFEVFANPVARRVRRSPWFASERFHARLGFAQMPDDGDAGEAPHEHEVRRQRVRCGAWPMNQFLRDSPTFDAGRAERSVGVSLPAEYNPIAPHANLLACGANSKGGHVSTAKEELTRLIQDQPEDSSAEEIVRELAFHVMVERGLADSDARRIVSNEETARRIRSWRS